MICVFFFIFVRSGKKIKSGPDISHLAIQSIPEVSTQVIETTENISSDLFVLTSGENTTLSLVELQGAMGALGIQADIIGVSPQVIHLRSQTSTGKWSSIAGRTGFLQGIYRSIFDVPSLNRALNKHATSGKYLSFDTIYGALDTNSGYFLDWLPKDIGVGVETVRVQGAHPLISGTILKKALGKLITRNNGKIDLSDPGTMITAVLSRNVHIGERLVLADRGDMRRRRNQYRPFSLPISLSPNSSRALLNFARVKEGDKVLDPFCGTGGVPIEAALMKAEVNGSDISPRMIKGTKENFQFFQLPYNELKVLDIEQISNAFPPMDAVVTDPPYGRSTSIGAGGMEKLYERMFSSIAKILKPGGRCAIILPSISFIRSIADPLKLEHAVSFRVHRSLVRHFISLVKIS